MFKTLIKKILRVKNDYRAQSNLKIGKSVSIGGNVCFFKTAPIEIGDHTMIAKNVVIHTSTHDYNRHPMWTERIDRPVKIGCHVWIGVGVIILPGVIIEDYSVIGAGSVVTSHVPEGAIVIGSPARILKYRDMEKIRQTKEVPEYPKRSFVTKKSFLDKSKICKQKI